MGSVNKMLNRLGSLESQVPGFEEHSFSIITETLSYYIDGCTEDEFIGVMVNTDGLYQYTGIDTQSPAYQQLLRQGFQSLQRLQEQYKNHATKNPADLRFFVAGMVSSKSIGEWESIVKLKDKVDAQKQKDR